MPAGEGGARTADEQKDELEGRLGASLSAFDAMLLKEQQEAAARRAEQAESGGASGSGGEGEGASAAGSASAGGGSAGGRPAGEGRAGAQERTAGGSEGSERSSGSRRGDRSSRTGERNAAGGGAVQSNDGGVQAPPDVGDGRDDDVVARQLREAALNEKDPAIREKLWDEYRRYKGTRTGTSP
jgi:hypothetical protein